MTRISAMLLAILYVVVLRGFRLFEDVAGYPTGPYPNQVQADQEISGTWYNSDDLDEKWTFSDNGTLDINGKEHEYSVKNTFGNTELVVDGRRYSLYTNGQYMSLVGENDEVTVLYSETSEEYQTRHKEQVRAQRLQTECKELFSRYPDKDGWTDNVYCGDIPFLADADYIDKCINNGYAFPVKTPEELASFCWFVNTYSQDIPQVMYLEADIDLSGYEWAPMGWSGGYGSADHPFCGYVDGGGHTIKNMKIDCTSAGSCAGFIGWETWCAVQNISFDSAQVSGGYAGVVSGQAIGGSYQNITITNSTVNGSMAGSMLGWDANTTKKNCSADVIVNGEKSDFLSYNDEEKSKIVIEDPVEITIDENHTVTRPEVEGYTNLGWMVFYNGEQVLHRNAENEYSYTYFGMSPGYYEIYLTAFVSGQYVPISNTVSYTIE